MRIQINNARLGLSMPNKRQHNIGNPVRNILSLFLFSVGVFSVLAYASNTTADTAAVDCLVFKLESHTYYRFVDSKYHKGLQNIHDAACKRVEDGRWDLDKANKNMNSIVLRCGICRDNRINHDFEEYLKKELKMPESVVFAHKQFCRDTYDPAGWSRMNLKVLLTRVEWLRVEFFCQWTHEIANPSGFWINVFRPDWPCLKNFEERTDIICQKLRDGKITIKGASYRWQQEFLEVQKRIGPEAVRDVGKSLKEPIKVLIDMFGL